MNTEELHERSKQRLIANLAKKEEEIVALSNTCETCKFWLTINCKREAQNQKSNFSNLICDDYRQEEWAIEQIERLKNEVSELKDTFNKFYS